MKTFKELEDKLEKELEMLEQKHSENPEKELTWSDVDGICRLAKAISYLRIVNRHNQMPINALRGQGVV